MCISYYHKITKFPFITETLSVMPFRIKNTKTKHCDKETTFQFAIKFN